MAYHTPMWEELRQWPMVVKLRVVRALCGLSQAEFASVLAISPRTYNGWESGARPIPYRTWQWLNDGLADTVRAQERVEGERRKAFVSSYGGSHPQLKASEAAPEGVSQAE